MRQDEVHPSLHAGLVAVSGKPNVVAVCPPPTPRSLAGLERPAVSRPLLRQAGQALVEMIADVAQWQDWDVLTHTAARREAVLSSQIEGTQSDLDQLLEYEVTRDAEGMPADVVVTHSYVEALKIGLAAVRPQGRAALTLELVHQLQARLLEGALEPALLGCYRQKQVWIGASGRIEDALYVPPPPALIPALMEELQQSLLDYQPREDEQGELSIVLQLALAHAQFEAIHPYIDGNGRTGRLLMPLMLAGSGYPPLYLSGYLCRDRQGYFNALRCAQLGQSWTPWVEMVCRAVLDSVGQTKALASDLQAVHEGWLVQLGKVRRDAVLWRITYGLLSNPNVTVNSAMDTYGVTFRAANLAIARLEETGILVEKTGRQRGRIFRAPQVIEILSRPATI